MWVVPSRSGTTAEAFASPGTSPGGRVTRSRADGPTHTQVSLFEIVLLHLEDDGDRTNAIAISHIAEVPISERSRCDHEPT